MKNFLLKLFTRFIKIGLGEGTNTRSAVTARCVDIICGCCRDVDDSFAWRASPRIYPFNPFGNWHAINSAMPGQDFGSGGRAMLFLTHARIILYVLIFGFCWPSSGSESLTLQIGTAKAEWKETKCGERQHRVLHGCKAGWFCVITRRLRCFPLCPNSF